MPRLVADFLGSSDLFTGTVRAGWSLTAPQAACVWPGGAEAGDTATIAVLDTRTHLSLAAPAGKVNAVPVKVIGEESVGATATVYLETPGGQEIRVQKGHDELADLPLGIGQPLFAWWNPEDAHLVAEA